MGPKCNKREPISITVPGHDPTTTQLADNNDDNLFSRLYTNGHQVLKQLLPDKTNYQ